MTVLLDDFLLRGLIAAVAIAMIAGPLGCLVIWRRLAYFGDATAHASLLGVAIALLFSLPVLSGVLIVVLVVAVTATLLSRSALGGDAVLGVAAHSGLALGVVGIALAGERQVDLHSYLFGEVLGVTDLDVAIIGGAAIAIGLVLIRRWKRLVTVALSPDLAHATGINPKREDLFFALMLGAMIAISIKIVGALLITAMLILPAAAARFNTRTPEAMAFLAAGLGCLASILGFIASDRFDLPTGPTIIALAALIFAVSAMLGQVSRTFRR